MQHLINKLFVKNCLSFVAKFVFKDFVEVYKSKLLQNLKKKQKRCFLFKKNLFCSWN